MVKKRPGDDEQRPLLEGFDLPTGETRRNLLCCLFMVVLTVGLFVYVNIELFQWNKAKGGGDAWHQVQNGFEMQLKFIIPIRSLIVHYLSKK